MFVVFNLIYVNKCVDTIRSTILTLFNFLKTTERRSVFFKFKCIREVFLTIGYILTVFLFVYIIKIHWTDTCTCTGTSPLISDYVRRWLALFLFFILLAPIFSFLFISDTKSFIHKAKSQMCFALFSNYFMKCFAYIWIFFHTFQAAIGFHEFLCTVKINL